MMKAQVVGIYFEESGETGETKHPVSNSFLTLYPSAGLEFLGKC